MVVARNSRELIHSEELKIPSLHIVQTMKSLKSKNFVREQFCWGFYYWFLTNEGIINLRQVLQLPPEMLPMTHHQPARTVQRPPRSQGEPRTNNDRSTNKDDCQSWRRHPQQAIEKKTDSVGAGTGELEFRGGFNRGYRK